MTTAHDESGCIGGTAGAVPGRASVRDHSRQGRDATARTGQVKVQRPTVTGLLDALEYILRAHGTRQAPNTARSSRPHPADFSSEADMGAQPMDRTDILRCHMTVFPLERTHVVS